VQAFINERPEMGKSGKITFSAGDQLWMRRSAHGTVKYMTKDEVRRFFRAIPKEKVRDRLLFNLMYLHGLRRGEAAILTVQGVQNGRIFVSRLKHGVSKPYQLFPSSSKLLARYLRERRDDPCPYLFRGRQFRCAPLSGRLIDHLFRRYATAAGLPEDRRHSHVFRHSIGVHLANEGFDISDVGDHLGHADLTSTAIYFEITDKRRAANFKRMLRSREIEHGGGS